jgi:hypothetical protein
MTTPTDAIDAIQTILRDAGFYHGSIDHQFGKGSRAALDALIKQAESTAGQPAPSSGVPDESTFEERASTFKIPTA